MIRNGLVDNRSGQFMEGNHTIVVILVGLLAPSALGGDWQEFAVWPTTDHQEAPDVYGNIVVWQQYAAEFGDYDIYVADMNRPDESLIAVLGDANDQMSPAIFEDLMVWQDFVVWQDAADWDIRMADISDRNEPQLYVVSQVAFNDEQKPAIHGNIVVWQDGTADDFDIYGADVTDPNWPLEFPIAAFEANQKRPAIYRMVVVWADDFFADSDIFAADIWRRDKLCWPPSGWSVTWSRPRSVIDV